MLSRNHVAGLVTAATLAVLTVTVRDTTSSSNGAKWSWLVLLGIAGIAGLYRPARRQLVRIPIRR